MDFQIRSAAESDWPGISRVVLAAFGEEEGKEIRDLIADLLVDPSAQPSLSLVATVEDDVVGHVLFTRAAIRGAEPPVSVAILAPLAVHPDEQGRGIGGRLIQEGIQRLEASEVALVFVLGDPGYYKRHGFAPAGVRGLDAPYPVPAEHADAWMVQALQPGILGHVRGQLLCADALDDPRYWLE